MDSSKLLIFVLGLILILIGATINLLTYKNYLSKGYYTGGYALCAIGVLIWVSILH